MKKKRFWILILGFLLVSLYFVVFRTQSVTYKGENNTWSIKVNAQLVGLNGSYNIKIHYKGTEPISEIDYTIFPHYKGESYIPLNAEGNHYYECNDDCGYFDKEQELLLFISWKENRSLDDRMQWIKLQKEH